MEVRKGYKQTDIGIIPEDWDVIKFDDLADKKIKWSFTGGPFGSNLKSSAYVREGVRIIQLQNIGDGVFHDDYAIYTSEQKANELVSCNIYPGEIILSKMGDPVARACLVPTTDKRYLMASDGIRLAVDAKQFDNLFVFYYINSINFRKKAIEASTGSTRQRIGLSTLRNLPFVAPPLSEQIAIATALSNADTLLNSLDALIAKKRLIKQGVMQELLTGKKRLPGFSGKWEETNLGKIAEITKLAGYEYTKHFNSYQDGGDIVVIRGTNITNNKLDLSDIKTIPRATSNLLQRSKLQKGDLVFAYVGTIGPIYLIDENDKYHLGPNTARITVKNDVNPQFVFWYFCSSSAKKEMIDHISVGAQPSLSMSKIRKFNISIPKKPEQTAIAEILSDMDAEISALEQKREKTRLLKQGMMQELLTGRIRLI